MRPSATRPAARGCWLSGLPSVVPPRGDGRADEPTAGSEGAPTAVSGPAPERAPGRVRAGLCTELARATPHQRLLLVLQLIAEHPEGRLVLPAEGAARAVLDGIDLSPDGPVRALVPSGGAPWWDAEAGCVRLVDADLEGASLRFVVLKGVDLRGARLVGANLGEADLTLANLERADLRRADLAEADMRGARLSGADLRGAMLEETDLRSVKARFVDMETAVMEGAQLGAADLRGAKLGGALLTRADLRGAILEEADLTGADLTHASLEGAVLRRASLQIASLQAASLTGVVLGGTDLRGANLRDVRLQDISLLDCDIRHVRLSGARLDDVRMGVGQLGGAIGEEMSGEHELAAGSYAALERNFRDLGDADPADWAYQKRRRMQTRAALDQARAAYRAHRWGDTLHGLAVFTSQRFVEWLCDYGQSINKVLRAMVLVYVLFALLYALTGSVTSPGEGAAESQSLGLTDVVDLAIFSLAAMMTGGGTAFLEPAHQLSTLLIGVHAAAGIFLTGLLGFVVGERIRR